MPVAHTTTTTTTKRHRKVGHSLLLASLATATALSSTAVASAEEHSNPPASQGNYERFTSPSEPGTYPHNIHQNRNSLAWRQQAAMSAFIDAGYTSEQAAGMVGNMTVESGVEPTMAENGYAFPSYRGWGLVQWTYVRNEAIVDHVKNELGDKFYTNNPDDLSPHDWLKLFELQIDYVIWELDNEFADQGEKIRAAETAEESAHIFLEEYEIPAGIEQQKPIRGDLAEKHQEVSEAINSLRGLQDSLGLTVPDYILDHMPTSY